MTEKPIIFSAPMVRALLYGRKTQTRRVLKPQPLVACAPQFSSITNGKAIFRNVAHGRRQDVLVPYAAGDRLWVKEAWRASKDYDAYPPREMSHWPVHYEADGAPGPNDETHMNGRLRSPIHMPRWASRLTLIVTDVRVQRVQEISGTDAFEEGFNCRNRDGELRHRGDHPSYSLIGFQRDWDDLKAKRGFGWDANPWVAAITFRVEPRNIDRLAP